MDINDIKKAHNEEINKRDMINNLQTRIEHLELKVVVNDIKLDHCEISNDNNEQYSHRHSIHLYGIEQKKSNETTGDVLHTIYNEMDKLNAPIDELEVDRAHRTGHKYNDSKGKWQQPVLLKFNSWKAQNKMYI